MNRLIGTTVLILMASSVTVLAQGTTMPQSAQPGATNPPLAREAPIGHRQPRRSELPQNAAQQDSTISAQDKQLDRMIKGICRGC